MTTTAIIDFLAIIGLAAVAVWAAVSDIRHYIIPNTACLAIVLLFILHAVLSPQPVDWIGAIVVAAIALAIGILMYTFGFAGAGDVKLFTAVALWAGPAFGLTYVVVTALAGGLLGLIILARLRLSTSKATFGSGKSVAVTPASKPGLPYGVAITAGGLFVAGQLAATSAALTV